MERTLKAINDFHHTECDVPVIETYENDYGRVAVVKPGHITWAGKQLCGMTDCTCTGPHALVDEDGNSYSITVP
jgi:hypothetical protein